MYGYVCDMKKQNMESYIVEVAYFYIGRTDVVPHFTISPPMNILILGFF